MTFTAFVGPNVRTRKQVIKGKMEASHCSGKI